MYYVRYHRNHIVKNLKSGYAFRGKGFSPFDKLDYHTYNNNQIKPWYKKQCTKIKVTILQEMSNCVIIYYLS